MNVEAAIREIAAQVIEARIAELNAPMMTLDQVAERLSTSTATVRRLIANRKLKAVDIGTGGERGNQRLRLMMQSRERRSKNTRPGRPNQGVHT